MSLSRVSGGIFFVFFLFPLVVVASFDAPQDLPDVDPDISDGTHDLDRTGSSCPGL